MPSRLSAHSRFELQEKVFEEATCRNCADRCKGIHYKLDCISNMITDKLFPFSKLWLKSVKKKKA